MLFWNSCAKDEAIGSGSQNKHCATQPVFYWGLILLWGLYNQSKYLLLLYLFFSLVLREKKYSSATLHLLLNLLNKLLHHFNWFSQHLGFYWVAFCLVHFSKPHLPQSHKNFFFTVSLFYASLWTLEPFQVNKITWLGRQKPTCFLGSTAPDIILDSLSRFFPCPWSKC